MANRTFVEAVLSTDDWREYDAIVAGFVAQVLNAAPDKTFTTAELATAILGKVETDADKKAADRFYAALRTKRLPTHDLSDYARRDDRAKLVMGKLVHGWLWQAPQF